ncbi:MAG: septum formation initiator family protein [Armatimonadota bacterium]|nr:septum formation initiator family protein [Armatimonadota bacterium]MDR7401691.1 septum formation initiator family protein [Armatimonadota bacterium]MDR7403753.1 septum formation initiator family protein [Armatimonadota bacterium]MDR7436299.1 septum formation initiator family protein [Armatimonadota bacterium]MDR7471321.1 septum formation initiator family protein [Armatimonadota bacterium]
MSLGSAVLRGRSRRRLAVGAAAAAVGAVAAAVFGSATLEVYRLEREAARLQRLRTDLIRQNAALREEIRLLHTPAYIEKLAREQLGLVRPDEVALLIVPASPPPPAAPPAPPPRDGWPRRLWRGLRSVLTR